MNLNDVAIVPVSKDDAINIMTNSDLENDYYRCFFIIYKNASNNLF